MNTPLKALNTETTDLTGILTSSDTKMSGSEPQFDNVFKALKALKFDGVDSISLVEPQVLSDAITLLANRQGDASDITTGQTVKLDRSQLLAISVSEADAIEAKQANLQHSSVGKTLSLGLDLPNNGDDSTIIDETKAEEDLMDTTAVTASKQSQPVNVFVSDTTANTDAPSFNQLLGQQNAAQSGLSKNNSRKDQDGVTGNKTALSTLSTSTNQDHPQEKEDDLILNLSVETDSKDPVDHAIMLAQLMQSTQQNVADQKTLKSAGGDTLTNAPLVKADSLSLKLAADAALIKSDQAIQNTELLKNSKTAQSATAFDGLISESEADSTSDTELSDAKQFIGNESDSASQSKKAIPLTQLTATDETDSTVNSKIEHLAAQVKEHTTKDNAATTPAQPHKAEKAEALQAIKVDDQGKQQSHQDQTADQQFNSRAQHTDTEHTQVQSNNTSQLSETKGIQGVQASAVMNGSGLAAQQPTAAAVNTTYTQNINTPVGYQNWDQALSQRVTMMIGSGNQSATLTLNPPELGPLQVTVHMQNNGIADATFVSAHTEVRQAIEAAIPKLREMLDQSGIQLGQANINAQTQQQQSQQQQYASAGSSGQYNINSSDDTDLTEESLPVVTKIITQGKSAVDTFA